MPIFVIAPIVGWSWIMLSPLIMTAAGALGYKALTGKKLNNWLQKELHNELHNYRRVELPLDEVLTDVVAEEIGREERLDFTKNDILLTFRKNALGKFKVMVTGPRSITTMKLKQEGDEFARMLIQQFSHSRIARELDQRGVHIVGEEITEDGDIILRTRKWN